MDDCIEIEEAESRKLSMPVPKKHHQSRSLILSLLLSVKNIYAIRLAAVIKLLKNKSCMLSSPAAFRVLTKMPVSPQRAAAIST